MCFKNLHVGIILAFVIFFAGLVSSHSVKTRHHVYADLGDVSDRVSSNVESHEQTSALSDEVPKSDCIHPLAVNFL
jgi:hypothetical protein